MLDKMVQILLFVHLHNNNNNNNNNKICWMMLVFFSIMLSMLKGKKKLSINPETFYFN
ncbi:MAG: hypothetical protein N7Q72_04965 [Spiroplasma sp. Tabriz.8]|nr:hypothetical protein [Spiroplasma sp. Tabriz.8]